MEYKVISAIQNLVVRIHRFDCQHSVLYHVHPCFVFQFRKFPAFATVDYVDNPLHFVCHKVIQNQRTFNFYNVNFLPVGYRIKHSSKPCVHHLRLREIIQHSKIHGRYFYYTCKPQIFKFDYPVRVHTLIRYNILHLAFGFAVFLLTNQVLEEIRNHQVQPIAVYRDIQRYERHKDCTAYQCPKRKIA